MKSSTSWLRNLSGATVIVIVILSVYFGAVAAAARPSLVGPSLTLYQLDSQGQSTASATNVFESGALVGVRVPEGVAPPFALTVTAPSGLSLWTQQNSSIPANSLIAVSLSPSIYSPDASYSVSLKDMVPYSPGFYSPQTSAASFNVVPALAYMRVASSSFLNNAVQASIDLQDGRNSPLTGVRLGLFLLEGNTSLELTTEKTDLLGRSNFQVGQSLGGGNYKL